MDASSQSRRDVWRVGDLVIDEGQQLVMRGDDVIQLPKLSLDVLLALVRSAPDVVSIDALLTRVWPGVVVSPETVVQRIKLLRDALDDHAEEPRYIVGLRGRGYRLVAEVSKTEALEAVRNGKSNHRVKFAIGGLGVLGAGALLTLAWMGQRSPEETRTASVPETPSIAVLPFADMSAAKDQAYMADGMAEELLNLLSQVPELKVIARTSSFAFKGQNIELAQIGKRLNVAYVLEGSVRKSGDRLRITAQLVRTADSTHLWSERYDRPLGDIFAVQDEIAEAVVSELKIKLLGAAPRAKGRVPEAFALFLKARDIGEQHTPLAYEQSISLYRQALELDPGYAEAWDGLANNFGYQGIDSITRSDEAFRLASDAAHKALALDPQYAQAHARLGWIAINYDRDLRSAARHLSQALALDPNNMDIIEWAGLLLRRIGRLDEAIEVGEYLVVHDPLNSDAHLELGLAHKYAGHWDDAIAQYRSVLALSPSAMGARGVIGEVLVLQGKAEAALAEVRIETDAAWRLHVASLAHHVLGQSAASEAALADMINNFGEKYAAYIVEDAAFRGDIDLAFEWLDRAAQSRDPSLGAIPFSQFCENLHKDPRWLPYLRKHGMAPEQLAAIEFDIALPR